MAHAFNFANLLKGEPRGTQCGGTFLADAAGKERKAGWPCPNALVLQPPVNTPPTKQEHLPLKTCTKLEPTQTASGTNIKAMDEEKPPQQAATPVEADAKQKRRSPAAYIKPDALSPLGPSERLGEVETGGYSLRIDQEIKRFKTLDYLQEFVEIRDQNGCFLLDTVKNGNRYYFCAEGSDGRNRVHPCPTRRTLTCINEKEKIYELTERHSHCHSEPSMCSRQRWTLCVMEAAKRLFNSGAKSETTLATLLPLDPPFSSSITNKTVSDLKYRYFQRALTGTSTASVRLTNMEMLFAFVAQYQKHPSDADSFWIFPEATLPPDGSDFQLNFSTPKLVHERVNATV